MTTTDPTTLLNGADGRRLADLARRPGRPRLPWRLSTCTADPLVAQRGVDHVVARVRAHTGPMLVGQIHLVAAGPEHAVSRLELIRHAVDRGIVIGYPVDQLDTAAASLAEDPRRWLIYAAGRVLTAQCEHTAGWS